jgi:hypothetical protein
MEVVQTLQEKVCATTFIMGIFHYGSFIIDVSSDGLVMLEVSKL